VSNGRRPYRRVPRRSVISKGEHASRAWLRTSTFALMQNATRTRWPWRATRRRRLSTRATRGRAVRGGSAGRAHDARQPRAQHQQCARRRGVRAADMGGGSVTRPPLVVSGSPRRATSNPPPYRHGRGPGSRRRLHPSNSAGKRERRVQVYVCSSRSFSFSMFRGISSCAFLLTKRGRSSLPIPCP
jgi:hypothetical protein